MKTKNLLFVFLLVIVLFSYRGMAQMQSVITTATKRTVGVNADVVKSVSITPTKVLTLSRVQLGGICFSVFSMTDDSNNSSGNTFMSAYIPGVSVEDFVVFQDKVYFCGRKIANNKGFFAEAFIPALLSGGNSITEYVLSQDYTNYTKIDIYDNAINEMKLSLIADTFTFVDANLTAMSAGYYRSYDPLVDVRHGLTKGVLLSTNNNGIFKLYTFDKNNPSSYTGYSYLTPTLYTYDDSEDINTNTSNYRYLLEVLGEDISDDVVVGYSSTNIYSGTELCHINLLDFKVKNTQAVVSPNEVRSYLYDIKFDRKHNGVLCLINNSALDGVDNIFLMFPNNYSSYSTPVTIPDNISYKHWLKKLSVYSDNYYLAIGQKQSSVYLFDKKIYNYEDLHCLWNDIFYVDMVETVHGEGSVKYDYLGTYTIIPQTMVSYPTQNNYIIDCQ